MFLTELHLEHFRTYHKQHISFAPKVTCFIGPNAVGKTNILEAIYAMSTGSSFRASA
ncbi:MAG: DNA replication and repair protein RecF, partial [Nitrosopumilales archaeon]